MSETASLIAKVHELSSLCTCGDGYHPSWVVFQHLGMLGDIRSEGPLLDDVLAGMSQTPKRVLVGGAADAGSLRLLAEVCPDPATEFVICDRCPAAIAGIQDVLRTNDSLARRSIDLRLTDLRELPADEQYDLVLLHYTLSFLPPAEHGALMRELAARLSPEGRIVCAMFCRPADAPEPDFVGWLDNVRTRVHAAFGAEPEALAVALVQVEQYAAARQRKAANQRPPEAACQMAGCAGLTVLPQTRLVPPPSGQPGRFHALKLILGHA